MTEVHKIGVSDRTLRALGEHALALHPAHPVRAEVRLLMTRFQREQARAMAAAAEAREAERRAA